VECLPDVAIVPRPISEMAPVRRVAAPPAPARWRRWLRRVAAAACLLAVVVPLTFPTETIVRTVLARATPATGPFLVFRHAVLRPWGLRLDGPALRRVDGSVLIDAEWVRVRPSLLGLLHDGTGRPWHVASGVCRGTIDADVSLDRTAASIDASWTDLDAASCATSLVPGLTVAGRVSGSAVARAGNGARPSGHGELRVADAMWQQVNSQIEDFDTLHADAATFRWTVEDDRLTIDGLDMRGPELELRGGGVILLTGSPATNELDLRLTAAPGPDAPDAVLHLLDQLPRTPDGDPVARSVILKGTAANPRIVR
jgi:type II secretion system protein N